MFTLSVHTPAPVTISVSARVFIPRNTRACWCSECEAERGGHSGLPAAEPGRLHPHPCTCSLRSLQGSPTPQRSDSAAAGSTMLACAAAVWSALVPTQDTAFAPPPQWGLPRACDSAGHLSPRHPSWAPPPSGTVFRVCARHSSLPTWKSAAPLTTPRVFPPQSRPCFPRPTPLPACHPVQTPQAWNWPEPGGVARAGVRRCAAGLVRLQLVLPGRLPSWRIALPAGEMASGRRVWALPSAGDPASPLAPSASRGNSTSFVLSEARHSGPEFVQPQAA